MSIEEIARMMNRDDWFILKGLSSEPRTLQEILDNVHLVEEKSGRPGRIGPATLDNELEFLGLAGVAHNMGVRDVQIRNPDGEMTVGSARHYRRTRMGDQLLEHGPMNNRSLWRHFDDWTLRISFLRH